MNEIDLTKLIQDVGTFQAQYQPVPIANQPTGCVLPPLLPGEVNLPPADLPDIPKICAPLFIAFPLVPEPFIPPDVCPNGLSVTPKVIEIYPTLTSLAPSGSVTLKVGQDPSDTCNYIIDFPPIVIPCYPAGPQISGSATITVVDSVGDVLSTSSIGLAQDTDAPCNWVFTGNPVITLPGVPCPDGFTFTVGTPLTVNGIAPPGQNFTALSGCDFSLNLPAIDVPCSPDGPQITITAAPVSGVQTIATLPLIQTGCDFTIPIPCPNGFTYIDAQTTNVDAGMTSVPIVANFDSFVVTYPSKVYLDGTTTGTISVALTGWPGKPGVSSPGVCGTPVYTWIKLVGVGRTGCTVTSPSGPGPYGPWVGDSVHFTMSGTPGVVNFELNIYLPNPQFGTTGTENYNFTFSIPVSYSGIPGLGQGLHIVSLQDYQSMIGMPATSDCGMALVGSLPCPGGYSVDGGSGTLTFGVTGYTGATAENHVTQATTLGVSSCELGFNVPNIPALICPGGYTDSTVSITVNGPTGYTGSAGTFTGTIGNVTGNTHGQYCGFAINGTLTLPTPAGGGGGGASNVWLGEYNALTNYTIGNIVHITDGTSVSLYLCLAVNGPATQVAAPSPGIKTDYWECYANGAGGGCPD